MTHTAAILRSWEHIRPVFAACANGKGLTSWIDLVRILDTGQDGIALTRFRGTRNSGVVRRRLNRWEKAGLVILYHNLDAPRHATNRKPLLYIRATPKAAKLLRL